MHIGPFPIHPGLALRRTTARLGRNVDPFSIHPGLALRRTTARLGLLLGAFTATTTTASALPRSFLHARMELEFRLGDNLGRTRIVLTTQLTRLFAFIRL